MSAHDEQQAQAGLLDEMAAAIECDCADDELFRLEVDRVDAKALRAGAAALRRASPETGWCEWHFDDAWRTTCGLTWGMDNDATPAENEMAFCPKCGGRLVDLDHYLPPAPRPQEAE